MKNPDIDDWDRIADAYSSVAGSPLDHISELFRGPLWESFNPVAGLNVLDVGCGSGWLAGELHRAGANVVGIDGAPKLLALAQSTHPEIRFLHHDLTLGLPALEVAFD